MAWIESHQEIGRHPKTKKLARRLGVSIPTAVGHLHLLWHWAMDFAEDGNLDAFEDWEIADAALWEGEPVTLIDSLIDIGFIDVTPDGPVLHDWHDYAGKLIQRRKEDAERKRKAREKADNPPPSDATEKKSNGRPADVRTPSDVTVPYRTQPNPTGESNDSPTRARRADNEDTTAQRFDVFWSVYPKKIGKGAARSWWQKRKPSQELTERMCAAVREQSVSDQWTRNGGQYIPNPATWLNQERWEDDLPPAQPRNVTPFQNNGTRKGGGMSSYELADYARELERQGQ